MYSYYSQYVSLEKCVFYRPSHSAGGQTGNERRRSAWLLSSVGGRKSQTVTIHGGKCREERGKREDIVLEK